MKILLSPIVGVNDKNFNYTYGVDLITAEYDGVTDVFDFSIFTTDGEIEGMTTILAYNPVSEAKRENGILSVQLLNFIPENAAESDRYPIWMEV